MFELIALPLIAIGVLDAIFDTSSSDDTGDEAVDGQLGDSGSGTTDPDTPDILDPVDPVDPIDPVNTGRVNPTEGTAGDDDVTLSAFSGNYDGLQGDDFIKGLGGNDVLTGGDGNDTLVGGADDDTLFGGVGDDAVIVDAGTDTVTTGGGKDVILITSDARVTDFDPANDVINMDRLFQPSDVDGKDPERFDSPIDVVLTEGVDPDGTPYTMVTFDPETVTAATNADLSIRLDNVLAAELTDKKFILGSDLNSRG